MHFLVTIRIALRALRKNKMRAGLTILGVVIGIAAVTAMVSIGQSASRLVQGQFESLGTNVIVIFAGSQRHGPVRHGQGTMPTLTAGDSGEEDAAPVPAPLQALNNSAAMSPTPKNKGILRNMIIPPRVLCSSFLMLPE